MKSAPVPTTIRVLSALLTLGAVIGVVTPILVVVTNAQFREAFRTQSTWWGLTSAGVGYLMFGWSFWLGVQLWDGSQRSLKLARLTFIAQIPTVGIHGIGYGFQTLGVSIRMLFVSGWTFNVHAGSDAGIGFVPFNQNLIIGINVVAIVAAVYLSRIISAGARTATASRGFGLI